MIFEVLFDISSSDLYDESYDALVEEDILSVFYVFEESLIGDSFFFSFSFSF